MSQSGHGRTGAGQPPAWAALALAAVIAVCVAGLATTQLRLLVAGLPLGRGLFTVGFGHSLLRGVIVVAVGIGGLVGFCAAAYATASRRWSFHGVDWADIVHDRGVRNAYTAVHSDDERRVQRQVRAQLASGRTPTSRAVVTDPRVTPGAPGAGLLRIVAGFNLIVLSAVLALAAAQFVAKYESAWWAVVPTVVIVFAAVVGLVTWLGPLAAPPWLHAAVAVVVAIVGLLASPPVGLLILAGVVIATWGRRLARDAATLPRHRLAASPLPWVVAALYAAVVIGYEAMPPVSFPGVVINSGSAQYIGGALHQSPQRVALLQCIPRVDGTSTATRLQSITSPPSARTPTVSAVFDSGSRPSLAALVLNLVGIDGPRAYIVPSLRVRQGPCAGAPPTTAVSPGYMAPQLGPAVIAGPAPAAGRAQHGEPPIGQTADPRIAGLARRYQPTLEVTVADRFWPVAVDAAIDAIGPGGTRTCLFASQTSTTCLPALPLPTSGDSTAYLRFPATRGVKQRAVTEDPTSQFFAFERGEGISPGTTAQWFTDPGRLDPWRTAQIYFYYEGPVHFDGVPGKLPSWPGSGAIDGQPVARLAKSDGLLGLEYWFFYPYNYYPLAVDNGLMNLAPLAAHVLNVDRHQGDWEHVTVLLDQRTLRPAYLYTARHADEGAFYPWSGGALRFDSGHPIVQAAFGGHPSYPDVCGQKVRTKHGGGLLSDWVSCGSGRFAFRATTTPLVDLASRATSWACWPGHFGEARLGFEISTQQADWFTKVLTDNVFVAGPRSPLWQAENGSVNHLGVCDNGGAAASETAALHGPLAERLGAAAGQ